jgi:hypothetical protein
MGAPIHAGMHRGRRPAHLWSAGSAYASDETAETAETEAVISRAVLMLWRLEGCPCNQFSMLHMLVCVV